MVKQPVTPTPAEESSEPSSSQPAIAPQEVGWILKPGLSSIGLYIQVIANADELTTDVVRSLEQLISDAHGATVHNTMMRAKDCPSLKSCGAFDGTCGKLTSCSSYY